jgi:hypothetical protein
MYLCTILSFSLAFFIVVSAAPTQLAPRHHKCTKSTAKQGAGASNVLGATYFITNKANNTIVVSSIGADGTLSFEREVQTGGAGGSASGAADALFTQDAIIQSGGVIAAMCPKLDVVRS